MVSWDVVIVTGDRHVLYENVGLAAVRRHIAHMWQPKVCGRFLKVRCMSAERRAARPGLERSYADGGPVSELSTVVHVKKYDFERLTPEFGVSPRGGMWGFQSLPLHDP